MRQTTTSEKEMLCVSCVFQCMSVCVHVQMNETKQHQKLIACLALLMLTVWTALFSTQLACICLSARAPGLVKMRHTPFIFASYVKIRPCMPEI